MTPSPLGPGRHIPQPGWDIGDDASPSEGVGERFLAAMGTLAAAVTVISAASPTSGRTGMTATAVCSLSNDPPMLVACVNRSSSLAKALATTGWFTVNLLAAQQESVAGDFAGRTGLTGDERFREGLWWSHVTGAPVLHNAAASFVCHVANSMQQATHLVVIGSVHDVVLPENEALRIPLMYHQRKFTTLTPGVPSD